MSVRPVGEIVAACEEIFADLSFAKARDEGGRPVGGR